MKALFPVTAFALALGTATPAPAFEALLNLFEGRNDLSAQMGPASRMKKKQMRGTVRARAGGGAQGMRPPVGYQGQWFTTSNGCSYSRAGGGWFLILNPHHIGQPNAHTGCSPTL